MPLKSGRTRSAVAYNIRLEKRSGKSTKQSVAIALHKAGVKRTRRGKKAYVRKRRKRV